MEKNENGTDTKMKNAHRMVGSSKRVVRILGIVNLMKENETITASEIVDRLELSVRTIKRDIEYLKVMKVVRCEDTAKYGKWIISE